MSYNPKAFGAPPGFLPGTGTVLTTVGSALVNRYLGDGRTTSTASGTNRVYEDAGPTLEQLGAPQKKTRRRRRRLLTCGDKADIAFLHGQLGGGALGRAAISSLLSRRCG
jgi:hypothetical protein